MSEIVEAIMHGGNERGWWSKEKPYDHKGKGMHPTYGGYRDLDDLKKYFEINKIIGIFQEKPNLNSEHCIYRIYFEGQIVPTKQD